MAKFIAFRLLQFPLILAVIYLGTFALCWVAPGDPFSRTDKKLPQVVEDSLRRRFHAQTWYTFVAYYPVQVILHGDLGPSLAHPSASVNDMIRDRLPISMELGALALAISTVVGVSIRTL